MSRLSLTSWSNWEKVRNSIKQNQGSFFLLGKISLFLHHKFKSMTPYFEMLDETEYQQLKDALALITIYIAGADGSIEKEEMEWAEKVTEIRSYKMSEDLLGFYQELNADFHEKVNAYLKNCQAQPTKRNTEIEAKLASLNPIMAKLDVKVGATSTKVIPPLPNTWPRQLAVSGLLFHFSQRESTAGFDHDHTHHFRRRRRVITTFFGCFLFILP